MLRSLAATSIAASLAACSPAASETPSWKLTRDGLERHRAGKVVLVALPYWTWAGPPYGRPLALGFGPRGEVLVTSDVVPAVWRVDARTLAVTVHALALDTDAQKDVGFTAIAYSRAAAAYFARGSIDGACWRIDAALNSARKFRPGETVPLAAAGMCMQE